MLSHQCQDMKCMYTYRQQELKEDMSAGKTRDALMKVFHQKTELFCKYNLTHTISVAKSILEGESLWNTQ